MGLKKKIQAGLGQMRFNRETARQKHPRKTISFDAARKIGLLYDATEEQDFEIVKEYVKTIRGRQKDVLALGYVNKRDLPVNQFAQLGLDFFTRKQLNWQLIPQCLEVSNFIKEPFDILINLCGNHLFPLRYIAALSHARLRVGRFERQFVNCYEIMIDTNGDSDLKHFIRQTEEYLSKLKTSA